MLEQPSNPRVVAVTNKRSLRHSELCFLSLSQFLSILELDLGHAILNYCLIVKYQSLVDFIK